MYKPEKRIIDLLTEYFHFIILGCALVLSVIVRKQGMHLLSGDYYSFLLPWFERLKENGGFNGLRVGSYDYYIPYMCILALGTYFESINLPNYIKIVSIVSEYVCAFLGGAIFLKLSSPPQKKKQSCYHRQRTSLIPDDFSGWSLLGAM